MARTIVVGLGGEETTFSMSKIDRTKLYGRKRRVHLGPDGEPCTRGSLTEDGSLLVQSGMTAQGYFDENQTWVPSKELVGLDAEGNTVEPEPSTLGVMQELEEIDPTVLLDLRVKSIYALSADEFDEALQTQLNDGTLFRFKFNYRADYQAEVGILIANDDNDVFAIIGHDAPPDWLEAEAMHQVPDFDDDDDSDDLDFEMF